MKTLILYYSYGSNTRKIAEIIQSITGGDLEKIETVQPYPDDYNTVVKQAEVEVKKGFEPEIKPLSVNIDDYDTIFIGTPIWWYTFAPPVRTVLTSHAWKGKTVYPFATHGGGIGSTFMDYQKFCSGANVMNGLDIYFNRTSFSKSEDDIRVWANKVI